MNDIRYQFIVCQSKLNHFLQLNNKKFVKYDVFSINKRSFRNFRVDHKNNYHFNLRNINERDKV